MNSNRVITVTVFLSFCFESGSVLGISRTVNPQKIGIIASFCDQENSGGGKEIAQGQIAGKQWSHDFHPVLRYSASTARVPLLSVYMHE